MMQNIEWDNWSAAE